jgi:hypothetical protein
MAVKDPHQFTLLTREGEAEKATPRSYPKRWLDTGCTSARHFHGWKGIPHQQPDEAAEVVAPKTWLLETGWLRHGRVRPDEVPGRSANAVPRGP